jgi:hypothetical protein
MYELMTYKKSISFKADLNLSKFINTVVSLKYIFFSEFYEFYFNLRDYLR